MFTIGPSGVISCFAGRLLCALCGFTLGGYSIGASNSGLARRKKPAEPEPEEETEAEAEEVEPIEEE